jgi:hypothetical protein
MGPEGSRDIYGGYGVYGDSEPDLRDYRTPPFIERELLDPANPLWQPGNIFLRLHSEYLYPCLGERIAAQPTQMPLQRHGSGPRASSSR